MPVAVKKIPFRYYRFLLPLVTTFVMTFIVTGVATWRVLGVDLRMFEMWFSSWMIAWVVAAPTMFFVMPLVRRALARVVEDQLE